jgi:general secretion pathway protein N
MMKPGQFVFIGLASGCAVLIASAGLLLGGVGMEVAALTPQERALAGAKAGQGELDSFRLPPYDDYAAVIDRPLFNDDRLPQPDDDDPGLLDPEDEQKPPPMALNVTVNGIIITPDLKIAMITDNTTKERLRLRENMPLEGDQGAWVLQRIEPRKLVFEGGGDEPAEVELLTHTKALKGGRASPAKKSAGKKPAGKQPAAKQGQEAQSAQAAMVQERLRQSGNGSVEDEEDRAAKAEEIRRRVAERRAQLREEAERRRAEQEDDN